MQQTDSAKSSIYKINYALCAAFLTAPIVLLIFFCTKRLPGQEWIFLHSDLRILYAAFAKLFWRSLLSGEGIGYTFHVSLGMPSVPLYTVYSMSPFNILYILIDHVELASIFLVVLKLSLSAYTFQRFSAKMLKNDSISSVFFSMAYALNGYSLIYYFNITFLDGIYMLPVIALLISESVKEYRFAKLTLAYAYLFVAHFYEGYIIGFLSLLLFILLAVVEYQKDVRKYIASFVRFGISVIIAALISAAFLYPTAVYLLSDYGNQGVSDWILNCNILDIYRNLFMGQYQTMESPYPYVYCGIMTLYLVPCFFTDRRIKMRHKLAALTALGYLLICSLWLPGYQFMHCFDVPDGFGFRFAYFYPFVLLAIGCAEWKYMDSKRSWKLVLLCVIHMAGYLLLSSGKQNITMRDKVINIVFLIIICAAFILIKKYGKKPLYMTIIAGVVSIELLVNGIEVAGKFEMPWTEAREVYQALSSAENRAINEIKAYDQTFYRVINKNPYEINASALNNYYGMVYFSTMENDNLKELLGLLGYAVSQRMSSDNGGMPLTEMIFSQKYRIVDNNSNYVSGIPENLWTSNDRVLSLGFMVSDDILYTALESDNVFENQNTLAAGLTGQDIKVFIPYAGDLTWTTENMSVLYNDESYGLVPEEGKTEGSVTFYLEDISSLPVYVYYSQEESSWLPNAFYFQSGEKDQDRIWVPAVISLPQIIELEKDSGGKYYIGIYFDKDHMNYNYYKAAYSYCYEDAAVDKVYEQLKDNQMDIVEMKGSDITAEIEVPADRHILFTSIPYDDGWHVLVDGEEAETIAVVNDTFLAVELAEGHHELKFYYDSRNNRIGVLFSLTGCILYIGMMLVERKGFNKGEN